MHTYNNLIDPLDKELDLTHMKIEKSPYKLDLKEKIKVWLDTLYLENYKEEEFDKYGEIEELKNKIMTIDKKLNSK